MNIKRILIILLFVAVTALLGYLLYFFFFKSPGGAPIAPPTERAPLTGTLAPGAPALPRPPGETLGARTLRASQVATGGLTVASAVIAAPTLGTTLSSDGSTLISYDRSSGKFIRVYEDGTTINISNKSFLNVENVSWAADGKKAVMEFPDGSNIVYDFESQKSITLPRHWEGFAFSPDGGKIVSKSIGADPENRWLITVDANGGNARVVAPLGGNADKVQVNWSPSGAVIAFSDTGKALGLNRGEILLVGQNGENFKGLEVSGMGFRPLWSPSGERLLWSTYAAATNYKPQFWSALGSGDEIGSGRRSFSLLTWADKCAFADEKIVYCAVPQNLPEGVGFQPTLAANSPDSIYRLDLETGSSLLIAKPDGDYSIKNLMVSKTERVLYFTDNATASVHQIKLQ